MRTFVVIAFFAVFVNGALSQGQDCNPKRAEECVAEMKKLYTEKSDGPVIVKNEEELSKLCRHQQNALDCINSYVTRCLSAEHRQLYNNLTGGVQEFIQDFCQADSDFRRVYVKHLGCFNKVTGDIHHCSQRVVQWHESMDKSKSHEETVREACCYFDSSMECMKDVVRTQCPAEAAQLFDQMIHKVSNQVLQVANCKKYSYDVQSCSAANAFATVSVTLFLLALASALRQIF